MPTAADDAEMNDLPSNWLLSDNSITVTTDLKDEPNSLDYVDFTKEFNYGLDGKFSPFSAFDIDAFADFSEYTTVPKSISV
jgi:hypothetical protein